MQRYEEEKGWDFTFPALAFGLLFLVVGYLFLKTSYKEMKGSYREAYALDAEILKDEKFQMADYVKIRTEDLTEVVYYSSSPYKRKGHALTLATQILYAAKYSDGEEDHYVLVQTDYDLKKDGEIEKGKELKGFVHPCAEGLEKEIRHWLRLKDMENEREDSKEHFHWIMIDTDRSAEEVRKTATEGMILVGLGVLCLGVCLVKLFF